MGQKFFIYNVGSINFKFLSNERGDFVHVFLRDLDLKLEELRKSWYFFFILTCRSSWIRYNGFLSEYNVWKEETAPICGMDIKTADNDSLSAVSVIQLGYEPSEIQILKSIS